MKRACLVRHGCFPWDPRVWKEASALRDAGWTVDVICLRREGDAPSENIQGISVHRMPLGHKRASFSRYLLEYAIFLFMAGAALARLHLRHRFDVVQVNTMPDILALAALIPQLCGTPVVLDMHEVMPELYMSLHQAPPGHWPHMFTGLPPIGI